MKNRLTAYCLTVIILVSSVTGTRSQNIPADVKGEWLQACTDRSLYIAGENILFSAIVFSQIEDDESSRILYCELLTPGGTRISGGKYPVENSLVRGCLLIPDETISGYYYLKSYTRLMRNYGQDNYHYIRLKIINPDKNEVLSGIEIPDSALISFEEEAVKDGAMTFRIITGKNSYMAREEISLKIDGNAIHDGRLKFCLAVAPGMASQGQAIFENAPAPFTGPLQYFPDTRGISMSGRLVEEGAGKPVPNAIVNLSIIGDKDMMAVRTDSSGRFFFPLPGYTGNHDIFLCAEDIPGITPAILIDNDFCTQPVRLPTAEFTLATEEMGTVLGMARNKEISSVYFNDSLKATSDSVLNRRTFYGEPDEILVMEKYIDLPTMEEYFQELVGAVDVRKYEGRKIFRFNSTRAEMTIYNPLVLIDWVAVDDIDRILAISPRDLERIELINAPYIKGNITYGGIISFVSKNNDYAGVDLPSSGTFINYQFLQECRVDFPSAPLPGNIPDSRNTLYWDPDLRIDENGMAEINFAAPDTPGKYVIVLSRLSSEGISTAREVFEVVGEGK
jgi:hypothetical protein